MALYSLSLKVVVTRSRVAGVARGVFVPHVRVGFCTASLHAVHHDQADAETANKSSETALNSLLVFLIEVLNFILFLVETIRVRWQIERIVFRRLAAVHIFLTGKTVKTATRHDSKLFEK